MTGNGDCKAWFTVEQAVFANSGVCPMSKRALMTRSPAVGHASNVESCCEVIACNSFQARTCALTDPAAAVRASGSSEGDSSRGKICS